MDILPRHILLWRLCGWTIVLVTIYTTLMPNPPDMSVVSMGDKLVHTIAYLGMMLWLTQCYLHQYHKWLAMLLISMGIGLEFIQGMSGYRTFEYADMLANSIGVILGWTMTHILSGNIFLRLEKSLQQQT